MRIVYCATLMVVKKNGIIKALIGLDDYEEPPRERYGGDQVEIIHNQYVVTETDDDVGHHFSATVMVAGQPVRLKKEELWTKYLRPS